MTDRSDAPVAIAVVSWNTRDLLTRCLRSLQADHAAGRAHVWVVDNGSTDGSPEMVRSEFPWVELIEPGENLGFGTAVNLVAEQSTAPWLAASNADVALEPGALETMLEAGNADARAGIVAPRLILTDGTTQHSAYAFPTLPYTLFLNLSLRRLSPAVAERLCLFGSWDPERARQIPWAVGAFVLIRRAAFDAAGGFDPTQWMYAEDLDLGWRVNRAGYTTWYEPRALVNHAESAAAVQAFGEERRERVMAATYEWMTRRRGRTITWTIAAVNCAGSGVRVLAYTALAPFAPKFWKRRHASLAWLRAHRTGLRTGDHPRESG